MMGNARIRLMWLTLAILSTQSLAADYFPTEVRRQAFLRALDKQDQNYDASAQMLRTPYSSPGYHTTLKDGFVHGTRNSLDYAVASARLRRRRAAPARRAILRRVIALQDQDPNSRTYGIWSWFLEEPLDKMSPPDWNWADFCGTQLLQVAHRSPGPPAARPAAEGQGLDPARRPLHSSGVTSARATRTSP